MTYKFHKLHGLGNDYIFFEGFSEEIPVNEIINKTPELSRRNTGIGSDGVILVLPSERADAKMRIFNSDGSEAEMCGNGVRCVIKLLVSLGIVNNKRIKVDTMSGFIEGETVESGDIRVKLSNEPKVSEDVEKVAAEDKTFDFYRVDVGNPHAVIYIPILKNFLVKKYGSLIESNRILFPERTNVEFIRVISNDSIEMRVWERGSGETLACGTGAAAAAAVHRKREGDSINKITVHLSEGDLAFSWEGEDFYMEGPATYVYGGRIAI